MKRGGVTLIGALAIAGVLYRPAVQTEAPAADLSAEQLMAHQDRALLGKTQTESASENSKEVAANPCLEDSGPFQKLEQFADQPPIPPSLSIPGLESGNFLIVTLPDPVHTELAMTFDEGVQSIERAATKSGYSFDRYWVPWQGEAEPAEPDCVRRKLAEEARELREKQPGLMVFRKGLQRQSEPLVVTAI
jgi:hypothetical protein